MDSNKKSATTHYVLHETPPRIIHHVNGIPYVVMLNGATVFDCGNGLTLPAPGCPCPEKLPVANLLYFLHVNRKWIPFAVGLCALAVLINVCLMLTSGWEMAVAFGQIVSFWMNATLIILACLSLIALGVYNFKKGVVVQWGEKEAPMLLSAGELSISPDILIASLSAEETPDEYRVRVELALAALRPGTLVVVMPYRQNFGVIQSIIETDTETMATEYVFLRSHPIHDGGGDTITIAQAMAAANVYAAETWGDYVGYCMEFSTRFKPWALVEKMTKRGNHISTILQNMATVFALVLFSIPAFAQKSAQVRTYLGDYRFEKDVPAKGSEVSFVFKKAVLTRMADGSKTYRELLPAASFFTDEANAGALIGITVGRETINPVSKTAAATVTKKEAAVSALPIEDSMPEQSLLDRLPDSTELSIMKAEHLKSKALEWRKIKPVIDYYMWRFWSLMVILFGIGGAFWVLAKVSAKDSIKDLHGYAFLGNAITGMHIWSKTVLFILMAFPTVVIIADDAIRAYYTQVFGFWFVIKYIAVYWAWQYIFEKVLPDSPDVKRNFQGGQRGNYPQLNG